MSRIKIKYQLYLHEQAVEEAIKEYTSQGFQIVTDARVGNKEVDLLAIKDDKKIFIEFVLATRPEPKGRVLEIKKVINEIPNAEFRVIYVTPPKKKTIEIEDIEQVFYEYLCNNLPDDVLSLATHASIADVSNVEILDIYISSKITIKGYSTIGIELQYGSNADFKHGDGLETVESFRANFEVVLSKELTVEEADFEFDLSDWYSEDI